MKFIATEAGFEDIETMAQVARIVITVTRFGIGSIAAYAVSVITMAIGSIVLRFGFVPFLMGERPSQCFIVAYVGAFSGIVAGSFLFAKSSRTVGSVALTLLGLFYYYNWWDLTLLAVLGTRTGHYPLALPLMAGGVTASLLFLSASLARKGHRA